MTYEEMIVVIEAAKEGKKFKVNPSILLLNTRIQNPHGISTCLTTASSQSQNYGLTPTQRSSWQR